MPERRFVFLNRFCSIFKTITLTNRIWKKFAPERLRGLAYGLDPYSSYLTAEQVKDFQNAKTSSKVGIGAEFSQVSSYLYVVSVVKGSPADKAGLKAGDVIEYIGTKATRDISLYDAQTAFERRRRFGSQRSRFAFGRETANY
jgi:C-terminal processing protease CtpA/Prc